MSTQQRAKRVGPTSGGRSIKTQVCSKSGQFQGAATAQPQQRQGVLE